MANIFDEMKREAQQYAEQRNTTIANLDKKLAEIEQQKLEMEAERQKARSSLERAENFPVKSGADWVTNIDVCINPPSVI